MHSLRSSGVARIRSRALPLALLALAVLSVGAAADSWTTVEGMSTSRSSHTATLLQNGQVLVAGGDTGGATTTVTNTSERYDPVSGHWLGSPSFATARAQQGASLLADGRVLLAGGYRSGYDIMTPAFLGSASVFDPATSTWRSTADMPHLHGSPTQVTLRDGRVLVIGGYDDVADSSRATDQVELYDPATGWSSTAATPLRQAGQTTTLLNDDSVLVTGGTSSGFPHKEAYRYLPATNGWRPIGDMTEARQGHVAALLLDGRLLVAGGQGDSGRLLRSASLYDPATNRWTDVAPMTSPRVHPTATALPNGKVLVAGGYDGRTWLSSADLFDPATNTWSPAKPMAIGRSNHTATLLSDGRVLVTGGDGARSNDPSLGTTLNSVEIYTPDGWPFPRGGSGSGGGGGTGGGTGGAPAISRLALSATRFRAAGSGPSVTAARKRRAPVGTTISYSNAAAATATFAVQRPTAGRRTGGRCARPTRANRGHRRCTRWVTVGRFTHADNAGPNIIRFSGRLNGHKLHPGRYRLSVSARVGHSTPSASTTTAFQIVR